MVTPATGDEAYAALVGRRVSVEAPASSANLGAGYDCLGLALDLVNTVTVEAVRLAGATRAAIELHVAGEGEGELAASRDNRFVLGLEAALAASLGPRPPWLGWRVDMRNAIPLARGLGSSAAATAAGVVAGDALASSAGGAALSPETLLGIATGIEGHPDNAAAVLLGGFVASAFLGDAVVAVRLDVPPGLRAVVFVPDRRLSTADMRAVLPRDVPRADAIANLGRVAVGVAGLREGRLDVLAALTVDRLHEPYRAAAYPELPRLTAAARQSGALGACLSGAGSTILAFVSPGTDPEPIESALKREAEACALAGGTLVLAPRNEGARVVDALG